MKPDHLHGLLQEHHLALHPEQEQQALEIRVIYAGTRAHPEKGIKGGQT